MAPFLLILALCAPIAWLIAEFQNRRWLRIVLGIGALFGMVCISCLIDVARQIDANSYYSVANQELIKATKDALKAGRVQEVIVELDRLDDAHDPTYEWRQNYQELVTAYSQKIAGDTRDAGN